ncbi:putative carbohydrate esterase [Rosellinia necatrix]|uniref:pectinesterase n=1 Tax=Rosellinia necatrix TaxID=77044 RepID=A0A1W2TW87_ROSNE|nr:putative carbohydrate esterase [Rosellinia necatrix]
MRVFLILVTALTAAKGVVPEARSQSRDVQLYPADGQRNVNPDAQLKLTFPTSPEIGSSGKIKVYDAEDKKLVDTLDLAIPFSPSPYGNGSTQANYTDTTKYQTNIIGGLDFYFNPILVRNNTATIYLHNNQLTYGRTYLIEIEPGVLKADNSSFDGFTAAAPWTFSTKSHGPRAGATTVTVAADGTGDFNTVQGAIDWAPANPATRTTIRIAAGNYEELVYWQHKTRLTIRGAGRARTIVGYPNNSAFNPPNRQGAPRRPAFSFRGAADVQLSGFSIHNYFPGQAEALLSDGARVVLSDMGLRGAGDALTTHGTLYVVDSELAGAGDTVLGYASAFWLRCRVASLGPVTWTRTVQGVRGNVFVDSAIVGLAGDSTLACLPDNTGGVMDNWPFAEMVLLDTRTDGILPEGWGPVQGPPFDSSRVRFWEFNTTDLQGQPVDTSRRLNISRQLTMPRDRDIIAEYRDPVNILGGWRPVVIED